MTSEPSEFRIAIIGSGPAGLYAATELLKRSAGVQIDLFDRLPRPFGLLRFGVAPDHQHTRRVCRVFSKSLADPRLRFLGGVTIGHELTISELQTCYHAVIIATGSQKDRRLGLPGAHLAGCYSAMAFTAWINGHPDYAQSPIALDATSAVIVGNGNVALDIARLLLCDTQTLRDTDIAPNALAALERSRVECVTLVGRRGAAQASFSAPELEEVVSLPGCDVDVSWGGVAPEPDHAVCDILQRALLKAPAAPRKRIVFRFFESPLRVEGEGRVERLVLARNRLVGSGSAEVLKTTDETLSLDCGLLFESIGHTGVALPGVPFDPESGVIPTVTGRVTDNGVTVPGLYAAGWITRGARGLIGHSKRDAHDVVDTVLEDTGRSAPKAKRSIDALLKAKGIVPVKRPAVEPRGLA